MTIQEIAKLAHSNEAPNDWIDFAIFIHNKTIEDATNKVIELRNKPNTDVKSYTTCNKILRDILKQVD